MLFDFATIPPREGYKLLISTVTPRPIAWLVTQDKAGVVNAAPFSFFNVVCGEPPVVAIGIGARGPGQPKDSRANVEATRQFVVNLVSNDVAEQMNVTAIDFPPGEGEVLPAGLTAKPSSKVKPPRIAESPVALECELMQVIEFSPTNGLVLGRVVAMHIDDKYVLDPAKFYVDTPKLGLLGRMHGAGWYARTTDLFELPRLTLDEFKTGGRAASKIRVGAK